MANSEVQVYMDGTCPGSTLITVACGSRMLVQKLALPRSRGEHGSGWQIRCMVRLLTSGGERHARMLLLYLPLVINQEAA